MGGGRERGRGGAGGDADGVSCGSRGEGRPRARHVAVGGVVTDLSCGRGPPVSERKRARPGAGQLEGRAACSRSQRMKFTLGQHTRASACRYQRSPAARSPAPRTRRWWRSLAHPGGMCSPSCSAARARAQGSPGLASLMCEGSPWATRRREQTRAGSSPHETPVAEVPPRRALRISWAEQDGEHTPRAPRTRGACGRAARHPHPRSVRSAGVDARAPGSVAQGRTPPTEGPTRQRAVTSR